MTQDIDRGYELTKTGLKFTRDVTLEEWRYIGLLLFRSESRTQWAIGDWLVYCGGRGDYGKTYEEAADITGRSQESLSQHSRVSKAYPHERRSHRLSWSFYRAAMRLEEAHRLPGLALAEEKNWSYFDFERYIERRLELPATKELRRSDLPRSSRGKKTLGRRYRPNRRKVHVCPVCGASFTQWGMIASPEPNDTVQRILEIEGASGLRKATHG